MLVFLAQLSYLLIIDIKCWWIINLVISDVNLSYILGLSVDYGFCVLLNKFQVSFCFCFCLFWVFFGLFPSCLFANLNFVHYVKGEIDLFLAMWNPSIDDLGGDLVNKWFLFHSSTSITPRPKNTVLQCNLIPLGCDIK